MQKSKKNLFIGIFIIIVMVFLTVGTTMLITVQVAKKSDYKFTIMSDITVMASELIGNGESPEFKKLDDSKMAYVLLSEGIFTSAVDDFIASDSNILLLTGGLTADGSLASHRVVVNQLNRIKAAGKEAYVINGDTDTGTQQVAYDYSIVPAREIDVATMGDFAKLYADFGYGKGSIRDESSLSYVHDFKGKYSLLALDYCSEGALNREEEVIDSLILWSEQQVRDIRARGRVPIGLTHMPVVQHLGKAVESFKISGTSIKNKNVIGSSLLYAGLNVMFVGHMFAQDIATYSVNNLNNGHLYEIETASIAAYPSAYRTVEIFNDTMEIRTVKIDDINPTYFAPFINSQYLSRMTIDYRGFCKDYMKSSLMGYLRNAVSLDTTLNLLSDVGISEDKREELSVIYEDFIVHLEKFFFLPLYEEDSQGEHSLQWLAKRYSRDVPNLGYKTIGELLISPLVANAEGDENLSEQELEAIELVFYALFYYVADFDLFDKLHNVDAVIPNIDISSCVDKLFSDGILSTKDEQIIYRIVSIPAIAQELPFKIDKIESETDFYEFFGDLLNLMKPFDIDFSPYLNEENCEIDIKGLLYGAIYGDLAADFIKDFGVADNDVKINTLTLAWDKLEKVS